MTDDEITDSVIPAKAGIHETSTKFICIHIKPFTWSICHIFVIKPRKILFGLRRTGVL
jgi:hypothetical protein